MEKISWTNRVKEISHGVKEERNTLHSNKRRKANWTGHILRSDCFLNTLFKGRQIESQKWREDEEEEANLYWITLKKREDTEN